MPRVVDPAENRGVVDLSHADRAHGTCDPTCMHTNQCPTEHRMPRHLLTSQHRALISHSQQCMQHYTIAFSLVSSSLTYHAEYGRMACGGAVNVRARLQQHLRPKEVADLVA